MRVPGIVFASKSLLPDQHGDMALQQVANVATLPGIVRASYAMPDVHWGYGFPIGGVAATDIAAGGVDLAGWGRFRHFVRGAAVGERTRPRSAAAKDPGGDGSPRHCDTARRGHQRCVAAAESRCVGRRVDRWRPVRGGPRTRCRTRPRAMRRRWRARGSRRGHGQRPGRRTRAWADRQPRLGQPLPGSAGRGPRLQHGRGHAYGAGGGHRSA